MRSQETLAGFQNSRWGLSLFPSACKSRNKNLIARVEKLPSSGVHEHGILCLVKSVSVSENVDWLPVTFHSLLYLTQ